MRAGTCTKKPAATGGLPYRAAFQVQVRAPCPVVLVALRMFSCLLLLRDLLATQLVGCVQHCPRC